MTISYAVTVWNELEYIQKLLPFLLENKREEDEVVVRWDESGPKEVWDYLSSLEGLSSSRGPFYKDFARWKNNLNSQCSNDYIYQIDADEMIDEYVLKLLPQVLEMNSVELLAVPRINTVEGLTEEHIQKWRWNVNDKGWINFPDYQTRIYRNDPRIRWHGAVHERVIGHSTFAALPEDKEWCLIHHKEIERQESQNALYDTIQ
jgi:hypothetical protein